MLVQGDFEWMFGFFDFIVFVGFYGIFIFKERLRFYYRKEVEMSMFMRMK